MSQDQDEEMGHSDMGDGPAPSSTAEGVDTVLSSPRVPAAAEAVPVDELEASLEQIFLSRPTPILYLVATR